MFRYLSGFLISIILCAFIAPSRLALADTPNTATPTFSNLPLTLTVTGRVASGTAGVTVPAGIPITLQIAHPDAKTGAPLEALKRDVPLGADRTFTFENIIASAGDIAIISTVFQGVVQVGTPIQLTNGQTRLDSTLTLYAVTNDINVVTLLSVQHILDFKGNVLQVLATYNYANNSDRLYLSADRIALGLPVSVRIPLPVGAQAIAFNSQTAERFATGGDLNAPIVQDTKPVLPGQVHQIVFSYQLPYNGGAPIDQDYPYNTSSLEVLIPDDAGVGLSGAHVGSATLTDAEFDRTTNTAINPKRSYSQYTLKSPLKAGNRLIYMLGKASAIQPTKAPNAASTASSLTTTEIIAIVLIVIVLVVIGVVIGQRALKGSQR
ncbi:MAG: hypothetical protein ABI947_29225 [Chloroflexota bacterium]